MTLTPGTRLGPYELIVQVGRGGMGEVHKARDTRLDRIVAIKIISSELAEARDRFEREARTISSLQHPHICVLHDVGHHNGVQFLVMEYLEGETLAERLRRGSLPLTEVLRYAIEITSALQAAHDRGIIHRDLKPGNVMLTAGGAKLLDFGLARLLPPHVVGGDDGAMVVTREQSLTREGTILGTFQYMAPEQLEGQDVDARTDIFALGALIYEMATGRKAFEGKSQASLIAKILEGSPPALLTTNPATPPALDHLVRVCLAKAPAERWQTARDVLTQLQWIAGEGSQTRRSASWRAMNWRVLALAATAALVLLAIATVVRWPSSRNETAMPAGRFDVTLPDEFGSVVPIISPDARRTVIATTRGDQRGPLWIRALNSSALSPLTGTEGGLMPFWSPDGDAIAFFVDGRLKRIAAAGGTVVTLTDAPNPGGGAWGRSGDILFASNGLIRRVPETGGATEAVTALDQQRGEAAHSFPSFLPGEERFLYLVAGEKPAVYAARLGSSERTFVLDRAPSFVIAVRPGYLLFVEQQNLIAQPIDLRTLTLGDRPHVLASGVPSWAFSASQGVILFAGLPNTTRRLAWFDRAGQRVGVIGEPGEYRQVVLAPSGRRMALERQEDAARNVDLWSLDTSTGVMSRVTSDSAQDADPAWSPDENRIVFSSLRLGKSSLFIKDLTTGEEKPVLQAQDGIVADDWSRDGQFVIYRNMGRAVFALPMTGNSQPRRLVDTPFVEDQCHLSPDGAWIAFNSNESGRWEVYVAKFPDFTRKRQVSNGGGMQPLWRRDGKELFFLNPQGHLLAVNIKTGSTLEPSAPRELFNAGLAPSATQQQYGVTADGQRFLVLEPAERRNEMMTFLTNWTASLP